MYCFIIIKTKIIEVEFAVVKTYQAELSRLQLNFFNKFGKIKLSLLNFYDAKLL